MNKKILLTTIICLLINSSGITDCIEPQSANTSIVQTAVLQLSYSIQLPITIMNSIISGTEPLLPEIKPYKGPVKKPVKKNKNTASKYSLILANKITSEFNKDNCTDKAALYIHYCLLSDITLFHKSLPPGCKGLVFLCLLAFFIILSRSNLPWELSKLYLNNTKKPGSQSKAGFFYFYINISPLW